MAKSQSVDCPSPVILRKQLQELADPAHARVQQRFFKTGPGQYGAGDRFIGVRVPHLRKLAKQCRSLALNDVLVLLRSDIHEERLLALFMMVYQFERGDEPLQQAIYQRYLEHTNYINNWDLVDSSAPHIVGAYLHGKDTARLFELAHSADLWQRRIAVMATFYFIKRGHFDTTLALAKRLLGDTEDLIHKAVGWMLREVGKRDLTVECEFLDAFGHCMPRTVLRYAIERFPTEMRQRYLRQTRRNP